MADSLLLARGLGVHRGEREVCRGIDLTLDRGECVGIVGPNGSGKSSLLLGLRGLLPGAGEVTLDGIDPRRAPRRRVARRVAVVPQRMEFAFPYTVEEMVLLGRAPHHRPWEAFRRDDRDRVHDVLQRLGIGALADERVDAISGGERRKVFVARALVQEAGLLFLDEPTAGLDPAAQEGLLRLLRDLRAEGKGVLVVFHDVRHASRLSDRILGLQDGAALFYGPPDEVLSADSLRRLYEVDWIEARSGDSESVWLPRANGERP